VGLDILTPPLRRPLPILTEPSLRPCFLGLRIRAVLSPALLVNPLFVAVAVLLNHGKDVLAVASIVVTPLLPAEMLTALVTSGVRDFLAAATTGV
jgi:hypothetical protein